MDALPTHRASDRRSRYHCALLLAVTLALQCHMPALATDTLIIEAREVRRAGVVLHDVTLTLTPQPNGIVTTHTRAARVDLGDTLGTLSALSVDCARTQLNSPAFGCNDALIAAQSSLVGPLRMRAKTTWNSDSGVLRFDSADQAFAAGKLTLSARSDARGWTMTGRSAGSTLSGLRTQFARWFKLPESIETSGEAALQFQAAGPEAADTAAATLQLKNVNFGNEDATIAGEKLAATLQLDLKRDPHGYALQSRISSASGQALLGMVLLDLQANPLELVAKRTLAGRNRRDRRPAGATGELAASTRHGRAATRGSSVCTQRKSDDRRTVVPGRLQQLHADRPGRRRFRCPENVRPRPGLGADRQRSRGARGR